MYVDTNGSLPTILERTQSLPLPPSIDPFYTAPDDYQSAKPGEILRIRIAPGNLTSIISNSSKAYNILFRTTDTHHRPSWAVTTLFTPANSPNNLSLPAHGANQALLSYQIAYDSANLDSSPSYSFQPSNVLAEIPDMLGRGIWVNIPDYEGPLAPLGAGAQSSHATLDSIRAVLSSNLGLLPNTRSAMWGYSGGALASGWAAELQADYAPELKISRVVLGGTPSNIRSVLGAVDGKIFAGLIPNAILGLSTQHRAFHDLLYTNTKTEGSFNRTSLLAFRTLSLNESLAGFAFHNISDYLLHGQADLEAPEIRQAFASEAS
ncbi:hypothetical protein HYALB_00004867 [Hymenoscyphus albidus]|uniref:Uncharacterized protein n=1 Tax=Hymenoscyphus albidus TaxID=595503 RepID=A0A9N9M0S6_9HELO|nr:hypothetical protein HYALB_00004867 [Hymenoscyphus albidus]